MQIFPSICAFHQKHSILKTTARRQGANKTSSMFAPEEFVPFRVCKFLFRIQYLRFLSYDILTPLSQQLATFLASRYWWQKIPHNFNYESWVIFDPLNLRNISQRRVKGSLKLHTMVKFSWSFPSN